MQRARRFSMRRRDASKCGTMPSRLEQSPMPALFSATQLRRWGSLGQPELDLVEYEGSRANNIVLRGVNWTHCILKEDVECEPERRYKLLYWDRTEKWPAGNLCRIFS